MGQSQRSKPDHQARRPWRGLKVLTWSEMRELETEECIPKNFIYYILNYSPLTLKFVLAFTYFKNAHDTLKSVDCVYLAVIND